MKPISLQQLPFLGGQKDANDYIFQPHEADTHWSVSRNTMNDTDKRDAKSYLGQALVLPESDTTDLQLNTQKAMAGTISERFIPRQAPRILSSKRSKFP